MKLTASGLMSATLTNLNQSGGLCNKVATLFPAKGNPVNTYQQAQSRINALPPISYNRPDSLTRRGDVLIARFRYGFRWTAERAIADWREVIRSLFPGATVIKTTADRQNNIRCYFTL